MLGSALPFYEPNMAGLQGPRGCEPLLFSPRARIARSMPDWYAPRSKQFNGLQTPQQVTQLNVNRGLLIFELKAIPGSQQAGYAQLCISQADAKQSVPIGWFGLIWPNGGGTVMTQVLSYQQHSALTTLAWWMVSSVNGGCVCNVFEQEYYG
jgi:hypothetical protein